MTQQEIDNIIDDFEPGTPFSCEEDNGAMSEEFEEFAATVDAIFPPDFQPSAPPVPTPSAPPVPKPTCSTFLCNRPLKFRDGGTRGKCSQHGGVPRCKHIGCLSFAVKKGGVPNMCIKHGGSLTCCFQACTKQVKFLKGGKRNMCVYHGGFPECAYHGCRSKIKFMKGGIRDVCALHGGFPPCSSSGCPHRSASAKTGKCIKCFQAAKLA